MRTFKSFRSYILIPLFSAIVVLALMLLPGFRSLDYSIYDRFLHLKTPVEEDPSILLLDIDDLAIAQVGTWPWSRSVVAQGLLLLSEFEATSVSFDIEYVDESPMGLNSSYLREDYPRLLEENFSIMKENNRAFFQALVQGYIPLEEAESYIRELEALSEESQMILLDEIRKVARDNDQFLGTALRYFGNAYLTVNMLPNEVSLQKVPQELLDYLRDEISLKAIEVEGEASIQAPSVQPAIFSLMSGAAGAGFPNVVVDRDGVRRRIDLIAEHQGQYYPQLVLAPLLNRLGNPTVFLDGQSLLLQDAQLKDIKKDIRIPLDSRGRMLINWPPKSFEESFRHLSYNSLVVHRLLEEQIRRNLNIMAEAGYLEFFSGETDPLRLAEYADGLREEMFAQSKAGQEPDPADKEEYRQVREAFFQNCRELIQGDSEEALLEEVDRIINSPEVDEEVRTEYRLVRDDIVSSFQAIAPDIEQILDIRHSLKEKLKDSFVIIGHTGISTTDIGVNPFEKEYMNVGTHAAVANTIIQGAFLRELPPYISAMLAVLLTFLLALLIRSLPPLASILVGTAFVLGTLAAGLALFLFSGIYLPMFSPLLMVFISFLSISIVKFLRTEGEKSFLRSAFGHYLSNDVINQLIEQPERLNLGGEKKQLTAIFTDIKGFSTISEQLDPRDLVSLLNEYLTGMSDIILENYGTIDKYEGDAIIAFFGAPVEFEDHALRACSSALAMKRIEQKLNLRFTEDGMSPAPLETRIGINTGEMVVGNMGTLQKMDYTIMGNAVNLAARLEGVNKRYGTWILISEETRNAIGTGFVARRLDRVRVVGIKQPVRLFELVEEQSRITKRQGEALALFDKGLDLFETWKWQEAKELFQEVQKLIPDDGPSQFFIDRAEKFEKNPPPGDWDGVFNLTLK